MKRRMMLAVSACLLLAGSTTAMAQFSSGYNFFRSVRDRDGAKVKEALERPGSTLVTQHEQPSGDTALHIVTRGRDIAWMNFLMQYGASPNARDRAGNTPLHIAAQLGFSDGMVVLLARNADANAANQRGETPLITAVQMHDAGAVRLLVENGADPAITDHITGKSARDYAGADRRDAAILKLMDQARPTRPKAFVGPR